MLLFALWAMAGPVYGQQEAPRLPGITGPDERALLDSTDWPWRAVGRVNRRVGGFCTGTMVAPRLVLTAAHCLWNKRTMDWLPPESIHFLGGYRRGEYVAEAAVIAIHRPPQARSGPRDSAYHPAHDWALLVLAADLDEAIGNIPLDSPRSLGPGASVLQVGYSQDRAHILTAHDGCRLLGWTADQTVLTHDCDATNGDSGSPILAIDGGDVRSVGLHVGTLGRGDWALGLAIPAASFRTALDRAAAATGADAFTASRPPPLGQ